MGGVQQMVHILFMVGCWYAVTKQFQRRTFYLEQGKPSEDGSLAALVGQGMLFHML
jgi:hypothetical protein